MAAVMTFVLLCREMSVFCYFFAKSSIFMNCFRSTVLNVLDKMNIKQNEQYQRRCIDDLTEVAIAVKTDLRFVAQGETNSSKQVMNIVRFIHISF